MIPVPTVAIILRPELIPANIALRRCLTMWGNERFTGISMEMQQADESVSSFPLRSNPGFGGYRASAILPNVGVGAGEVTSLGPVLEPTPFEFLAQVVPKPDAGVLSKRSVR